MITPSYGLTATAQVLPILALNFTTAVTDARVTTSRALNTATRFNANGAIEIVNANIPRYDYDPVSLTCRGQLIEETRSNLFLNSLIDGTNLATQSVTLSAIAYTVSFYGTGNIVISGGHSATVTGSGAFPTRKTYTFTPTAGSSTFTVSGTVSYAQVEAGTFATSYIPTAASSATRNADVVTMTGTNFNSWYNASEGTFAAKASTFSSVSTDKFIVNANAGGYPNRFLCYFAATNNIGINVVNSSVAQVDMYSGGVIPLGTSTPVVAAAKQNNFAISRDKLTPTTSGSGLMPAGVDRLWIGSATTTAFLNGHIAYIRYYPQRLTNAEVQAFSA